MSGPKRILFTGGTGKAGRHVVPYLLDRGHRVLNVDLDAARPPGRQHPRGRHHRLRADVQRDDRLRRLRRASSPEPARRASTRWCISLRSRAS